MRVLVHYDKPELFLDLLEERFPSVELETCLNYADLPAALSRFQPEVLFAIKFEDRRYPRDPVIESPSLKWVNVGGAGVDHLTPWDPEKLVVTNGAGVASDVMANYVVAAIIAGTMRFPQFMRQQQRHQWKWGYVDSVEGKTLAIIGLGHVGEAVADRAQKLGLHVVGTRARPRKTPSVEVVYGPGDLHAALSQADYVAVCAPLLPETHHMIDAAAFRAMRPGTIFIDISRGGVVDSAAFISALDDGKLAGAVLDVFEVEPMPADCPLWDRENVLITPHSCAVFRGWERKTFDRFCDNLARYMNGEPLTNITDPQRGY